MKIKLVPRSTIKLVVLPRFPINAVGEDLILVNIVNGQLVIGLDIASAVASLGPLIVSSAVATAALDTAAVRTLAAAVSRSAQRALLRANHARVDAASARIAAADAKRSAQRAGRADQIALTAQVFN